MKNELTLRQCHQMLGQQLAQAGVDDARRHARLILQYVSGLEGAQFFADQELLMSPDKQQRAQMLSQRYANGEPMARLVGRAVFFEHEFALNAHCLVPRPETEHVVEAALKYARARQMSGPNIVDLGTGSGCIVLSLLCALRQAKGVGIDIASGALDIAAKNAESLGVNERVSWQELDMLSDDLMPVLSAADMIVSNPPYIPDADLAGLDVAVRQFDPELALVGGRDGLIFYRAIAAHLQQLRHHFYVVLEVGIGQANHVAELLEQAGGRNIEIINDLAQIPRVVCAQYGRNDETA